MGILAVDQFQRANGAIGASWTTLSGPIGGGSVGGFTISGNQAFGAVAGINAVAYTAYGPFSASRDMWAQFVYGTLGTTGGPMVRANLVDTSYLLATSQSTGEFFVYQILAGAITLLNTVSGLTIVPGDICYIEVIGSVIKTKQNGVLRNNFSDTSIDGITTGGRYSGMFTGSNTLGFGPFTAGDIPLFPPQGGHRPYPFAPGNPNYPTRF